MPKPQRQSGFTLVELLVVISVIAVLASLLIPTISYAKRLAKEAKCQAQLGNIKASLSTFKDANGTIPQKFIDPQTRKDVYSDTFKNDTTYKTVDQLSSTDWETIAQALLVQLQSVDRANFRDLSALRDPFTGGAAAANVFRYRPAKYYPLNQSAVFDIDKENPPNPDSYQLWSSGFDSDDQYGQNDITTGRRSDDITNWK
jgi:prepilin-type N-terminal cleavage/methylation domain-containing protein